MHCRTCRSKIVGNSSPQSSGAVDELDYGRSSITILCDCRRDHWPRRSLERGNFLRNAAGSVKTAQVRLHSFLFSNHRERLTKNLRCADVGRHNNSVVHPFAFTAGRHDPRPPQIRKMPRNLGLALPKYLDEIANANLPSGHQVQQPQPCSV